MNLDLIWQSLPWATIGGIVLWWLKDRRKDRAAAEVAEETVDADIAVKNIGVQDARLLHAIKAFDAERVSLERRIAERDRELERKDAQLAAKDAELEHRDRVITRLRDQVEELQTRLDEALRQLQGVRQELNELAEHDTTRGGGISPA